MKQRVAALVADALQDSVFFLPTVSLAARFEGR